MNSNFDKLKILIESLTTKPSVIVCTETFIQDNYNMYVLDGYDSHYNESKLNRNDGVIVFYTKDISQTTNTIESGRINIINTQVPLRNGKSLEISSVYRCHDIPKSKFILYLNKYLKEKKNSKNHLVVGDFNIDLLQLDNESQEFTSNFLDKCFIPGFSDVTRPPIGRSKGSCIDNIFIKANDIKTETYKLIHSLTDHYQLFIVINKINTNRKEPEPTINCNKLKNSARTMNWIEILSMHDPNEAMNRLICTINQCVETYKSIKKIRIEVGKIGSLKLFSTHVIRKNSYIICGN